uniref:GH10 domain-containing protein n=1 Tax=Clytia hemisphaerica TaxID=252671 RepID=A0A7M5U8U6_9CNID
FRMKIRGHCIFWAVEEEQPKWLLKADPMQLKGAMWRRLHDVLTRYKNRIRDWDVNNEMLHGSFYSDRMNETIRDWMYYEAHRIFPRGQMFVNEFEVLSAPWYTQSYVDQIRSFLKKGIPIDGIGVQGHFAGHAHPEILKERLDDLAVLGLPIWITELDVVAENDVKRAEVLEKIIRVAYAHPSVQGIVLWTFWDKHEWKKNTSLFEGHFFKPNEAGRRYLRMRNEWKTDIIDRQPDDVTSHDCVFRFRAFHGEHVIRIRLPDGSVLEQNVNIRNHPGELELVFNKQSPDIKDAPD